MYKDLKVIKKALFAKLWFRIFQVFIVTIFLLIAGIVIYGIYDEYSYSSYCFFDECTSSGDDMGASLAGIGFGAVAFLFLYYVVYYFLLALIIFIVYGGVDRAMNKLELKK